MMDLRCPACRHPVDVPDDHTESTIRCGICWAEVSLGDRIVPVALTAIPADEDEPPALMIAAKAVPGNLFAGIAGVAVKGHQPLEDLLKRVVERVLRA
jgi:hypothetical protein